MEKGLIGINLEKCLKSILLGEVSVDDISVILDDSVVSNDENKYKHFTDRYFCESIAFELAKKELGGISSSEDIKKAFAKRDELIPQVQLQADTLLKGLTSSGKVHEFCYNIPKGQEREVHWVDEYLSERVSTTNSTEDRIHIRIDDNNYHLPNNRTRLSDLAYHDDKRCWYDNELQIIAQLLKYGNMPAGYFDVHSSQKNTPSAAMAKLVFPQYTQEIDEIIKQKREIIATNGDSTSHKPLPGMDYEGILQKLEELVQQRTEHTTSEIGEGISDIRLEQFTQGLHDITHTDVQKEQNQK